MTTEQYDIAIVGAGLVGLSLAAMLGNRGFKIALIEARAPKSSWPQGSIDLRVFAISRVSQRLLADIGAWAAIAPNASAYGDMHVWDASGNGEIHFSSADFGEPDLGHIVESRVIEAALFAVIQSIPTIRLFCPSVIASLERENDQHRVVFEDGSSLSARLLIGADGKHSQVRDYAGIHALASDYGQQAMVAVVTTERGHDATAWQRFLPTGPLAFLPLRDGQSSIVWSATTDEAKRLLALDATGFCDELGEAFDYRLGKILACGERTLFPLLRQYAEHTVAPGVALVGDAAHVIHPLAGQGVNLGFKDVRELAAVLIAAQQAGQDIASQPVLRRYERARKGDNMATMLAMDGFKHLFGSELAPVRWLRNAGLNFFDAAAPLKNKLIRLAMGL